MTQKTTKNKISDKYKNKIENWFSGLDVENLDAEDRNTGEIPFNFDLKIKNDDVPIRVFAKIKKLLC